MELRTPRIVFAGLAGDAGKTLVAIGVVRALRRRGLAVAAYKKGPDYIDAAWLGAAAGSPGRNLDAFLMSAGAIGTALAHAAGADLIVVEGNRGMHDGMDARGTHSTAELARRLGAPIVIVADAVKATRTLAACVHGCVTIETGLDVPGVILNRVATRRHERVVREAFEAIGGPRVVGALPRVTADPLPSRHLGLVTAAEHADVQGAIDRAADLVAGCVDLDALLEMAHRARPLELPAAAALADIRPSAGARIAVFRDEAFSFYYPENLEALAAAGATLIEVSPLGAPAMPDVDAVYIGGGFPEVHAAGLAANRRFREEVRRMAAAGLPIYAECGGLMYLARELLMEGATYPMCGVFDVTIQQTGRPQGHGYVEAQVDAPNAFFPVGLRLRGHEFHYSRVAAGCMPSTALLIERGVGTGSSRDAMVAGRVWASYLHVHALATPEWARSLVAAAIASRGGASGGDETRGGGEVGVAAAAAGVTGCP